jgi:hypothetical protein
MVLITSWKQGLSMSSEKRIHDSNEPILGGLILVTLERIILVGELIIFLSLIRLFLLSQMLLSILILWGLTIAQWG